MDSGIIVMQYPVWTVWCAVCSVHVSAYHAVCAPLELCMNLYIIVASSQVAMAITLAAMRKHMSECEALQKYSL